MNRRRKRRREPAGFPYGGVFRKDLRRDALIQKIALGNQSDSFTDPYFATYSTRPTGPRILRSIPDMYRGAHGSPA